MSDAKQKAIEYLDMKRHKLGCKWDRRLHIERALDIAIEEAYDEGWQNHEDGVYNQSVGGKITKEIEVKENAKKLPPMRQHNGKKTSERRPKQRTDRLQ